MKDSYRNNYYNVAGTKGHMQYNDVPAGSHIFVIRATSESGEKIAVRRTVHVGKQLRSLIFVHYLIPLYNYVHVGESGDEQFCAVHLINEGVTVDGRTASVFFRGTEAVDSYLCKLSGLDSSDNTNSRPCEFV